MQSSTTVRLAARLLPYIAYVILAFFPTAKLRSAEPDFEQEVWPIFESRCLDCHGAEEQSGEFRVDRLASLLTGGNSGEPAVVPGAVDRSFLLPVLRHEIPELQMPPEEEKLSEQEIAIIEKWIEQGAETPDRLGPAEESIELKHWAFLPIERPDSNGVDSLLATKLQEQNLSFSPQADRATLIRRLYLVMLGFPPTPEQVAAFTRDERPDAWEQLIAEVLASPHYGERWASHWLDLVRFGETHGFETNRERTSWQYRDWVIQSLNEDKPYNQFVRQQLAGDALGQDLGTGFLVAGPYDLVKGQDPMLRQVQRMNELDDMINTTGTAFLGLSTGCARCHNHKFDPISQKDYYALQAVFAGVQHADRVVNPSNADRAEVAKLNTRKQQIENELQKYIPKPRVASIAIDDEAAVHLVPPEGKGKAPASDPAGISRAGYTWWKNKPGTAVAAYRPNIKGKYRIWLSWGTGFSSHTQDAQYVLQRQIQDGQNRSESKRLVGQVNQQQDASGQEKLDKTIRWSGQYDAGVFDMQREDQLVLQCGETSTAITADVVIFEPVDESQQEPSKRSFASWRPALNAKSNEEIFVPRLAKWIRFQILNTNGAQACIDELEVFSQGENVALASLGAQATSGGDFVHPLHKLEHINDGLYGNPRSWIAKEKQGWVQIELPEPKRIDRIVWARDREGKLKDRLAVDYRIEVATEKDAWQTIATSADRQPYRSDAPPLAYDFDGFSQEEAQKGRQLLQELSSVQSVLQKRAQQQKAWIGTFRQPGPTHRLYRGEPGAKREQVGPGGISSLHSDALASFKLNADAPEQQRRIALADWIADDHNPLTARVIVNRIWQFHFGAGIVTTPSDFGRNGVPPTHPELLDWLATELIKNEWSLKHIHRLLLQSQTWQQDSRPNKNALLVDAESRYLWRFPPRRLEAEVIRDSILRASGVLSLEQQGGPGFSAFAVDMENVRHYHPKETYGPQDWRRMIYMTKVRQEKDQVFGAFDCPDASMVVPKRSRSTTPLQALNLLNSSFVMQQAEILAERLSTETTTRATQIKRAWEFCFQRPPTKSELQESLLFIQQEGWVQFARALLNSNEFVFIP